MSNSTHLYSQLMYFLRQYSHHCDLRHLKALAWMVSGLVLRGQLSLCAWEPYVSVQSCQEGAKCGAALATLYGQRADSSEGTVPAVGDGCLEWLARITDFTWHWTLLKLWNRYCMLHLSVVCCGRAVPLLWRVQRAPQRHGGVWGVSGAFMPSPLAVATSPGCDALS